MTCTILSGCRNSSRQESRNLALMSKSSSPSWATGALNTLGRVSVCACVHVRDLELRVAARISKATLIILQFLIIIRLILKLCFSVFDAYMKLSGYEMEESIKRETSGGLRDLLLAVGTEQIHATDRFCPHFFLKSVDF